MILAVCKPGDAIILPREAHKSVLNGVVLSGAVPVYMEGGFAPKEDVALGPTVEAFHKAIAKRPDAKAVVFTYPTYDGVCCDLGALITAAHEKGSMSSSMKPMVPIWHFMKSCHGMLCPWAPIV